jgi:hypothetical protein
MWKRLVTGLGAAASLVLAAACASSALPAGASSSAPAPRSGISSSASTPSARSASNGSGELPQLTLRPASGPVGTYVTISGQLNPEQVRANEPYFQHPAYFNLITDVWADCAKAPHAYPYDCSAGPASLAGCELIVGVIHPLISLDTATGRVSGSFTVGGEGTCFQDRPTEHPQATLPGRYDVAIGCHACSFALFRVTGSPAPTSTSTAPVEVHVASCPVPAGDYTGTPYSPRPAPATVSLPASLAIPGNSQVFGTTFLPGDTSYLLGPKSATCQGALARADGGESMAATSVSHHSESVTMVIRPGGAGPSTDLACPYIPAVRAADEAFRQGDAICTHPSADVIRQIPTNTASLYAAAVLVPAQVKDPNIHGSGGGTDPTVALYTAWAGPDAAAGQMIACTLASAQQDICAASMKFFLATQSQISTRMSAANLTKMEQALSAFLAEQDIACPAGVVCAHG